MKLIFSIILFALSFSVLSGQSSNPYVLQSKLFLEQLKAGENTDQIVQKISAFSLEELQSGLVNDEQKLAFWINIYNGFILRILNENPELYEDRRSFFKQAYIEIAGRNWSFAEIEHGLIRSSQYEYGLGYIRKWFVPKYEI